VESVVLAFFFVAEQLRDIPLRDLQNLRLFLAVAE